MALFGKNAKAEATAEYKMAQRVLDQGEALCNCVLDYVDGTPDSEKRMISEVSEKKSNVLSLKDALREGRLDPQMCATLGFSLTFNQMLQIVKHLDASNDAEREFIDIARQQIALALKAGYGPAVELERQGKLPQ